jgi:hypothetical protein
MFMLHSLGDLQREPHTETIYGGPDYTGDKDRQSERLVKHRRAGAVCLNGAQQCPLDWQLNQKVR